MDKELHRAHAWMIGMMPTYHPWHEHLRS